MSDSILVIGGGGQVGTAFRGIGDIAGLPIHAPTRAELDLRDPIAIANAMGPDTKAVINCAAFTDVDGAESAVDAAQWLNGDVPGLLADACNRRGIPLVHFSTDYVFDGESDRPYAENDPIAPMSVYGRSKAEGERRILAAGGPHLIARTAWVVSPWRKNFVKTMLRVAAERDELRVVGDQLGCPTSAIDLADAIAKALPAMLASPSAVPEIHHLVNAGSATWYDLAVFIMDELRAAGLKAARVTAIGSDEYPTPVTRPKNSRLSTDGFRRRFGIEMQPWQPAIRTIIAACLAETKENS
ncbi:dTDP-4-dehydrorhamnose reductase [Sphingobium boeckii]|uniref:dTDP-4-dehydrorhamnose reductase n=1 Tax=Sphingobium boeckii TaxID=1082345 RepID=A0A7W9EEV1_9SPHN|nr:dTDP-4-dehydrorhamnose reductase [Sphingobium boeckii]MBB5686643.1 dTDP-4-dehydrorhamnose reductase [Sphingobium boeckii]